MWQNLVKNPAFPYCLPFALCMVFLMLREIHPLAVYGLYPLQTIGVGLSIAWVWKRLPSLNPNQWLGSVIVGILGVLLWVGLDHLWIKHDAGSGFNPWRFESTALSWTLIFFRVVGPALVIPIMEEIFWRGFLMRYLIQEDFEKIKLGTYTHFSFIVTTGMFALIHGSQWPLAVVVGLLYGAWFVFTKNLGNVIVAHGVTNLLLGLYVLKTGQWWFW